MRVHKKALLLHRLRQTLLFAFCLLLAAVSFLGLPTCEHATPPLAVRPDTTSHEFVWQIDTLGDGNSSVLNDVFIIDENNVWAAGEIYVKDATGQFVYPPYNAVHWNGSKWSMVKIPVRDYGGFTSSFPLKAVFGFAANDVWFASDADLIHWNGSNWIPAAFVMTDLSFNGQVLKMWGTSGSNLYLVGRNGAIYHYNGSNWQKLASGTPVDIQDIWGAVDGKTGQPTILAVASLTNYGRGLGLLQIQGTAVSKVDTTGLRIALSSVWFSPRQVFYVVGDGVFTKRDLADTRWQLDQTQPLIYRRKIRGNAWNDLFIVGDFGLVSHYNGSTWKHYTGNGLPTFFGLWSSVAVKGNTMVAVGEIDDRAIILRGNR